MDTTDREPRTDEDIISIGAEDRLPALPRLVQCCGNIPGEAPADPADRTACPACEQPWTAGLVHAMYGCPHEETGPVGGGDETACQSCGLRFCTHLIGGGFLEPYAWCDETATLRGEGMACDKHAPCQI